MPLALRLQSTRKNTRVRKVLKVRKALLLRASMIEQSETKYLLQADGYTQQGVSSVKFHVDTGKTTRVTNTPLLKTYTSGTGGLKIDAPDNMYESSR